MGIRQDQCNKVCRIIDDYLANRPRERDELIVAVRTVFKEADRKTEPKPICESCSKNPCKKKKMINDIGHWVSECTEFDRKTEPQTERVETMSCQECKHYEVGKPCKPFLNECDCHYEPQTDCSWKKGE